MLSMKYRFIKIVWDKMKPQAFWNGHKSKIEKKA